MASKQMRGRNFVDRKGWKVMPGDVNCLSERPVGEAYAIFDCKASKNQIESEIPEIRESAQIHKGLELSLAKGFDVLADEPGLEFEANLIGLDDNSYVLRARGYGLNNKQTADELSAVMNQAYQSKLYSKNENFYGDVFYKESGRFISR